MSDHPRSAHPLLDAIEQGDIGRAKLYLQQGIHPDSMIRADRCTPLHISANRGDLSMAVLLLDFASDPNAKDSTGATPLHYAVHNGYISMTLVLLDAGAAINVKDNSGVTPLHIASATGNPTLVEMLLLHRANPYAQDSDGVTPIDCAESDEIMNILLSKATPMTRDNKNAGPLFPIAINGFIVDPSPCVVPITDSLKANYMIVQSWRAPTSDYMEDAGLDLMYEMSPYTYFCHSPSGDIWRVLNTKYTIFAGIYPVVFKISPFLQDIECTKPYRVEIFYHRNVEHSPDLQKEILSRSHLSEGDVKSGDVQFASNRAQLTIKGQYIRDLALVDKVRYIERANIDCALLSNEAPVVTKARKVREDTPACV